MNIQLSEAEEHIPNKEPTKLGQILIRYVQGNGTVDISCHSPC